MKKDEKARTRVLVAEDSATARQLLVAILSSDPEIEVVGQATNGAEAVAMAKSLRPDLITMDIQMPVLDGLAATRQIMIEAATPIVIVSSLDERDVTSSMHSLNAGALAVLSKPEGPGSASFQETCRYFLSTVKAMSQVKIVRRWASSPPWRSGEAKAAAAVPARPARQLRAIGIAASTGGPAALRQLLGALPADLAVPVLIVQHIAMGFAAGLAEWLNTITPLRVKLAEAGEPLRGGTVFVAPDGSHLGVSAARQIELSGAPPVGGFRPSGSYLFRSLALSLGREAAGIILTGMGSDGVEGLQALRGAGGYIVAQDEATCEIFGMPAHAIAAGLPDEILPLPAIAPRIKELVG